MDSKLSLKNQYKTSLTMLKETIDKCPDSLWNDQSYTNKFWHIVFHTLYFTDLYSQKSEFDFIPWEKHIESFELLERPPEDDPITIEDAYTKEEIIEYYDYILAHIDVRIDSTDMDAVSDFGLNPYKRHEIQLHNIEHVWHHAKQLYERLQSNDIDIEWV